MRYLKYLWLPNLVRILRDKDKIRIKMYKIFNTIIPLFWIVTNPKLLITAVGRKTLVVFNINKQTVKNIALFRVFIRFLYKHDRKSKTRKYIPFELGLENFFLKLKELDVNYVILRWFEDLPNWPEGEDVDLLIDDQDVSRIVSLFGDSGYPCDTYSVSGLKGSNYGSAGPYFPFSLAERILNNKILWKGKYFIPDDKCKFLSIAYHVTYHKAEESGVPAKGNIVQVNHCDHDYFGELIKLANELDINIRINLTELHYYLRDAGLSPNIDTLRKLSEMRNSIFLKSLIPVATIDIFREGEIAVFILREWAANNLKVDDILKLLQRYRWDILKVKNLSEKEKISASKNIRGGAWGKGPFPVSGGLPAVVVVAFDYHPSPLNEKIKEKYPFVMNDNLFVKFKIRDHINDRLLRTQWTNCIHSSDDEVEAWDYILRLMPESRKELLDECAKRRDSYRTKEEVIKLLNKKCTRSKKEIIIYKGKYAVKATYKYGRDRFLQREIYAFGKLSLLCSQIPHLLDQGDNYYIIPWYKNVLEYKTFKRKKEILKPFYHEIIHFLEFIYNQGFALIDFHPDNVIITPQNEIKFIDFEFLHYYKDQPSTFSKSYDINGVPNDFDGDLPTGISPPGVHYKKTWQHIFEKRIM